MSHTQKILSALSQKGPHHLCKLLMLPTAVIVFFLTLIAFQCNTQTEKNTWTTV